MAHPRELDAVLRGLGGSADRSTATPWTRLPAGARYDVVLSGVGKSNAAGCVARTLDPARHHLLLNVGVAGVLPLGKDVRLGVGGVVLGSESVFADEGLAKEDGFLDLAAMGLGEPTLPGGGGRFPGDAGVLERLRPVAGVVGPIACVSTCSGTDALAAEVARRTGAIAEAMEGAACALVAARLGVPFAELRVISNTTGDRARQAWDLAGALRVLEGVIGRLAALAG